MNVDFKTQMMHLWRKIFGDSEDYVNMLFKAYFDKSYTDGCYDGSGSLISCMMAIPYSIVYNKFDNDGVSESLHCNKYMMTASYLCGLATDEKYRHRGVMSRMIKKCNMSLLNEGKSVSFLIPSDDMVRKYYKKFGYVDTTFYSERYCGNTYSNLYMDYREYGKSYIKYSHCINFRLDVDNIISRCHVDDDVNHDAFLYYNKFKDEFYNSDDIRNLIIEYYNAFNKLTNIIDCAYVLHTFDDFATVLFENYIGGGEILLLKTGEDKPLGILFCSKYIQDEAVVQMLLSVSEETDNILLETLRTLLPASTTIKVRCMHGIQYRPGGLMPSQSNMSSAEDSKGVVKTGSGHNNSIGDEKPYAMVKILNVAEVLKFVVSLDGRSEFSILINEDEFRQNEGFYQVCDGKVHFTPLDRLRTLSDIDLERKDFPGGVCHELSVPQLAQTLFGRLPSGVALKRGEIPAVPLDVMLMLD